MSSAEFERFERVLDRIAKLGGWLKWLIVSAFSACLLMVTGIFWVQNTTAKAEQTQGELRALAIDRQERIKDWDKWRRSVDEIDFKLTLVVEAQQKTIDKLAGFRANGSR